jgi:PucR family transcriptional regulator, purine catabolism regulatory protein
MADATEPRLCLGDLLTEEPFGLELLTGGSDAALCEVRGAHAVEVDAPGRWLARDWIMLTTGVRLRGNAEAQRALVPQLEAAEVSALGFGVGLGFRRVPPALFEVAKDRAFPLFAVPYATPFREIIRYVDSSLASGEEHVFRRLTALQRYLVETLRAPNPERAMVERLAAFLDAGVILMSADGEPEIVAGKAPVAELRREVRAQPAGLLELSVAGWYAVATPVVTRSGKAERWLVLASRRHGFITRLAKPAAEATAPLLAALARVNDVVRDQEQAVKAALLEEALEPVDGRALPPLAARAAAFGVDFSQPARLVMVRGHPRRLAAGAPPDLAAVQHGLVAQLERARVPHLVHRRGESLTALVQGGDADVRAAIASASESWPACAIGVGRPVAAIADAHHSLRDAELAVDRAGVEAERRVMHVEDLDLGTFVISEIPFERLAPKVNEILSVLRANPLLHEALGAYFAHDLDVAATAASLHIHRNSLRYRLARAEQLLGRSLKQPSTITAIHLALVAEAARPGCADADAAP